MKIPFGIATGINIAFSLFFRREELLDLDHWPFTFHSTFRLVLRDSFAVR